MALNDKSSNQPSGQISRNSSFEDPQTKRLAGLRARLPVFSMFLNREEVQKQYTMFLLQEMDNLRAEVRKSVGELETLVLAKKLGMDAPIPHVDDFVGQIERIMHEKMGEEEKKAYFTKWLQKFGPENVDKLYTLGVDLFETVGKKARGFARAQTIKAVSIVGTMLLLGAGGTLWGAHYLTRYNSTTQIQRGFETRLDGYGTRIDKSGERLDVQDKTLEEFRARFKSLELGILQSEADYRSLLETIKTKAPLTYVNQELKKIGVKIDSNFYDLDSRVSRVANVVLNLQGEYNNFNAILDNYRLRQSQQEARITQEKMERVMDSQVARENARISSSNYAYVLGVQQESNKKIVILEKKDLGYAESLARIEERIKKMEAENAKFRMENKNLSVTPSRAN